MSTIEITSKIEALKDLESLIEEAKAEAEALRDEIKTEMLNRNTEELEAGQYIVRWTSVLSQRFDTTAFKKVRPKSNARISMMRIWLLSKSPCPPSCLPSRMRQNSTRITPG